jgi:hypothetical protein
MSPVPRKQGEKTYKESYLIDYDASTKLRIELYYNDADEQNAPLGTGATPVASGLRMRRISAESRSARTVMRVRRSRSICEKCAGSSGKRRSSPRQARLLDEARRAYLTECT